MGGDIRFAKKRTVGGEPVADIHVRHSALTGIDVPAKIAPSMIDEFPILFIAAAIANGQTITSGLHELRVKESDRLSQMAKGLELLGVKLTEKEDGLTIEGSGGKTLSGGKAKAMIETALDHRIAMSFAIAGLVTKSGLAIDDITPTQTSFPGFENLLATLAS